MFKLYKLYFYQVLFCILSLGITQIVLAEGEDSDNFSRGLIVKIEGKAYQLEGVADTENGISDLPGHEWSIIDKDNYIGRHFNTGPFGLAKWWSPDADDGALLFVVRGIVDSWSLTKAYEYYTKGYARRHQLLSVDTGLPHPTKFMWLLHVAVDHFYYTGGPDPVCAHQAKPGIDYQIGPNWNVPYGEINGC